MNIVISPETQKLLEAKLRGGEYRSADEVLHAALQALDETSGLDDATLDAIDRSEDQIERGQVHNWADVRERVRDKFMGK